VLYDLRIVKLFNKLVIGSKQLENSCKFQTTRFDPRVILLKRMLEPHNRSFLSLIGFDITRTLYEALDKKLCNSVVSTWFLSCRVLAF